MERKTEREIDKQIILMFQLAFDEDERFGKLMELLDNLVLNARYVRNRDKCVGSEYMKVVEYVSDLILDNK
jgi:hypothetical protein